MRTDHRTQESEVRSQEFHPEFLRERDNRIHSLITDHRSPFTRRAGFSLVEVTLAVAVVAIGLIAILGLIPQAVQSSRDAADNTLAATIVLDTFNLLRTNSFHSATICDACQPSPPLWVPIEGIDLATYSGGASNVYDQAGFSTQFFNVTNAYFKVVLRFQPQTPLALTRVTATVIWPAQSRAPLNTNVFVTQIADLGK